MIHCFLVVFVSPCPHHQRCEYKICFIAQMIMTVISPTVVRGTPWREMATYLGRWWPTAAVAYAILMAMATVTVSSWLYSHMQAMFDTFVA